MTGIWEGFRSLTERVRGEFGGGTEWVEPGNWITRAVIGGELGAVTFRAEAPAARTYELAPDNVLIATSAPRPASSEMETDAASEDGRVARAG